MILCGNELAIGDRIRVGFERSELIIDLADYNGPLDCFRVGARIATFFGGGGMTIDNGGQYSVLERLTLPGNLIASPIDLIERARDRLRRFDPDDETAHELDQHLRVARGSNAKS